MHSIASGNGVSTSPHFNWLDRAKGKAAKVRWLWPGRIPLGSITFLEGRKGLGKSTIAAALAADVTGGPRVPPGGRKRHLGNVIWLTLEESMRLAVYPRLAAAGAVKGRVHFPDDPERPNRPARLVFPGHLGVLADAIKLHGVKLLILDPWTSFLSAEVRIIDEQQIRPVLEDLASMLEDLECAGVFMRHLTKRETNEVLNQGAGSVAVSGVARSILRVDRHPLERGRSVLAHVSGNIGEPAPTLVYSLADAGDVARVKWHGEEVIDVEELAAGQGDAGQRDERMDAESFLRSRLAKAWVPAKELLLDAKAGGIGERTLRRAKAALGVPTRQCKTNQSHWHEWGPLPSGR